MNNIISKASKRIDEIQKEIASILILKEEEKYEEIVNMTEKIANIAWHASKEVVLSTEIDNLDNYEWCILHENGTVYSDKEKELMNKKIGHIYILKEGNSYRIGKSINVEKRVKTHISSSPTTELFYVSPKIEQSYKLETELSSKFTNMVRNEWFLSDDKEVMRTVNEILKGYKYVL